MKRQNGTERRGLCRSMLFSEWECLLRQALSIGNQCGTMAHTRLHHPHKERTPLSKTIGRSVLHPSRIILPRTDCTPPLVLSFMRIGRGDASRQPWAPTSILSLTGVVFLNRLASIRPGHVLDVHGQGTVLLLPNDTTSQDLDDWTHGDARLFFPDTGPFVHNR